jgi:hypothetical protein
MAPAGPPLAPPLDMGCSPTNAPPHWGPCVVALIGVWEDELGTVRLLWTARIRARIPLRAI